MQKSTSFILPILEIQSNEFYRALKGTYLGNVDYQQDDSWGDYLYVHISNEISKELIAALRAHIFYTGEYDPDEQSIMFVFKLDEEFKQTVVKPFLDGKYSKISRKYVRTYFVQFHTDGTESMNWRVLHKCPRLRKYWENKLDVILPEDAEVWSKCTKKEEIYGLEDYSPHVEKDSIIEQS